MDNLIFQKRNALFASVYYFQYGLLLPFNVLFGNQVAVIVLTVFLISIAFFEKRVNISVSLFSLFVIPLLVLVIKYPFEYDIVGGDVALEMIFSYLTVGLSGMLLGTLRFSCKDFFAYGYSLSWLNFALIFYIPFTSYYGEIVSYMRFGYALLPSVLFSFYFMIRGCEVKSAASILFIISFLEMLFFGARGALLVALLFIFVYFYFLSGVRLWLKVFVSIVVVIFIFNIYYLLVSALDFLKSLNLDSYSITKILYLFEGRTLAESSSGRDDFYAIAVARFLDHPWIGSPVNSSLIDTGSTYYHNIVIDILVNFGVVALFFLVLYLIYHAYKALKFGSEFYVLTFLVLFLVPMGRLFVSSSFWQRPEFWFFMAFCIVNIKNSNNNVSKNGRCVRL